MGFSKVTAIPLRLNGTTVLSDKDRPISSTLVIYSLQYGNKIEVGQYTINFTMTYLDGTTEEFTGPKITLTE